MQIGPYKLRESCSLCRGRNLVKALSLPPTPLANEFLPEPAEQEIFPLDLLLCNGCGHLQVEAIVNAERFFTNYVYVTGTSAVTVEHLWQYAEHVSKRFKPSNVLEIGSNDGTMLVAFKALGVNVLGIDPAKNISVQGDLPTIRAFFDSNLAENIYSVRGPFDLIVANNVFAHVENLADIAAGVRILLDKSGVFVFEVAYLVDTIKHNLFDTIYHEHYSHHAVTPLVSALKTLDLHVFDVERTSGQLGRGSIRIYASADNREVSETVSRALEEEASMRLFDLSTYAAWREQIEAAAKAFKEQLARYRGNKIAGFGAPAKLTTLMYTFGLGREDCEFVVDDALHKQGLYTPGLNIPVKPVSALTQEKPDVCVIYAWNFYDSILRRFEGQGIKFIVPLPEYKEY